MTPTAPPTEKPVVVPYDPDRDVEDYVITESVFPPMEDLNLLKGFLKKAKTTGTLRVDFSQGTINRVFLQEKSLKADFDHDERSVGEQP